MELWSSHGYGYDIQSKQKLRLHQENHGSFLICRSNIYLFKTLVLPTFTYSSVIWSPYTLTKFERINGIIRKFLRYLSFKAVTSMSFDYYNYNSISERSGVYKIQFYHKYFDLFFILDNILKRVDCPVFKKYLNMREITYFLRFYRPLFEETQRNDHSFYSPIHRLRKIWNLLAENSCFTLLQEPTRSAIRVLTLEHFWNENRKKKG